MRNDRVDFIAKQASLAEEIEEFSKSMSLWEDYVATGFGENGTDAFGHRSYQSRTHNSASLLWEHYTPELMKRVYHYYKEDFDRFGFTLREMLMTQPRSYQAKNSEE